MKPVTPAKSTRSGAEVYAHKLFAPAGDAAAVPRETILKRVFAGSTPSVVVLQAPAGHGKTWTLQQIREVCLAQGQHAGWLTFDEADNDLRRFFPHIHALIGVACGDVGPLQHARSPARRRRLSDELLDRLYRSGRSVNLFLDEFQCLSDPTILSFWQWLFEQLPANVRFYIGSRSLPDVGLSRLLANQKALLLQSDDLRFSADEVERFFASAHALDLSKEEVELIYRRTEGWPAALQLFRLSLASPEVRHSLDTSAYDRPRELAEYLTDNVLALQPEPVREFLLRTSLLTRLTAPLCDRVMGREDSKEALLNLERSGLFVRSIDPQRCWFRYHSLFSTIMAEQLQARSPAECREVHRIAADWYLSQGLHEEVVHHALACGDVSLAAGTLDEWASRLTAGGRLRTVEHWADRLPFAEIAKRPSLAIKIAYALVFLRRSDKLPRYLKVLESLQGGGDVADTTSPDTVLSMAAVCADDLPRAFEIVERVPIRGSKPTGFAAFELSAAANLSGLRDGLLGNFERAHENMALAQAHSERGNASFSGGYSYGVQGMNLLVQGQLREALALFQQGLEKQDQLGDRGLSAAAMVSCHLWALYESDQLDKLEVLFRREHDFIVHAVLLDFLAVAALAMVRTYDARGRSMLAEGMLDEVENIAHVHGWERLLRFVTWERVRRCLLAGQEEKAAAIAAGLPTRWSLPDGWLPFSEDAGGETLGRIRLALYQHDFDRAAEWLAAELARDDARRYRRIRLYLLEAQLKDREGAQHAAHLSLRKALQLAAPAGFVRCFLDEGDAVLKLLREEYQAVAGGNGANASPRRTYIERLLRASGTDLSRSHVAASPSPSVHSVETLTRREREILVFLANGISNREMARRVFISENTVKFHLKNIYSKLAVRSRLQAVAAARRRGLIP